MSNNQLLQLHYTTDRPQPRARGCISGCISGYIIVCNKMAWSGKRPLESASESLLENLEFFAYACLWVQYSVECGASSC